tara:strand:- start:350 stop:1747 length:1398 start_codon:yes stop_codon:yes gene_type:complete
MAGKRANLTVLLKLKTRSFIGGLRVARAAVGRFAAGVAGMGLRAARAGMLAFTAALTAASVAMVIGVNRALAWGGRLSDVGAQTGISIEKIQLWEEALRQGGVVGVNFADMVSKMQSAVADFSRELSTQEDSFGALDISLDEIFSLNAEDQLDLITEKLNGIENASIRTKVARDIFGRSGAKMFAVIDNGSAMEKATQTLGSQIGIFARQAQTFDRISDIIGGIRVKIRGFFAGVADKLAPMLLIIAEKFDKIDLASKGQAFAKSILPIFENIGLIPEVLSDGLILAAAEMLNFLRTGLAAIVTSVAGLMGDKLDDLMGKGEQEKQERRDRDFADIDRALGGDESRKAIEEMRETFKLGLQALTTSRGGFGSAGVNGSQGSTGEMPVRDMLGNIVGKSSLPALAGRRVSVSGGQRAPFAGLDALAALQDKNKDPGVRAQEQTNTEIAMLRTEMKIFSQFVKGELV